MAYFQKSHKQDHGSNASHHQHSSEENNKTAEFKKGNQSKHSYLKAFKKYYIEKLQNKLGSSDIQIRSNLQNISTNKVQSYHENEASSAHKKSISKEKLSVATDCSKKTREKSTPGKISSSKIVNLVSNNDNELQEMLYSSITEMEMEMMTFGDLNDLARENKLLKCSITKLKQILKEKLEVALKKNKEELTVMFDQYSNMIKKLLEDKESLTNQLESERGRFTKEEKKWMKLEEDYQNQIKTISEENSLQVSQTKQQIEQFLDMIIQYEEEAALEKIQLQKLRQKVVELDMENASLKNGKDTFRDTQKESKNAVSNEHYEEQLQKYALKIESLLVMLEQLQNENEELNLFLKSCKCSKISNQTSKDSFGPDKNIQQIKSKYEGQIIEAEKQYLKQEVMFREVLKKKDECINRLNLVIEELRKARYASIDKMTEEALKKQVLKN